MNESINESINPSIKSATVPLAHVECSQASGLAWLSLFALVSLLGLACIVVLRSSSVGGNLPPALILLAAPAQLEDPFFKQFVTVFLCSFFQVFVLRPCV